MFRTAFIAAVVGSCICMSASALSVVETRIGDAQLSIAFDEEISVPADGATLTGFEVADRRYGRFIPAEAKAEGKEVTLTYPAFSPAEVQQKQVVWRYTGDAAQLAGSTTTGALQSFDGEIKFRAVPFGKYPAVGTVRIACVGDSITFGYGIGDVNERYPEKLGRLLGERFTVGRFGNSGKTAGKCQPGRWYGEQKEYTAALEFAADVYICNLGINDTSNTWWNPEASERDFATLIEAFIGEQNATVMLWKKLGPDFRGTPGKKAYPGNVFKEYSFAHSDNGSSANRPAMEAIIAKLAKKYKCRAVDAYTEMAKDPELYKVDGLHPTAEGATKLAEMTYKWLIKPYKLPALSKDKH